LITSVVMPQMGLEVTSGIVAAVHVEPGAQVSEGEALLELETDKALTDVVAPHDGVVRAVEVEVGDTVPLGATLVVLAGAAEGREPVAAGARGAERADDAAQSRDPVAAGPSNAERADEAAPSREPIAAGGARTADGRLRAAPVARRAAARLGIELETVEGTGPRGRITLRDVERAAGAGAADGRAAEPGEASPARAAESTPEPAPAPPPVETARPVGEPDERVEPMSATRAAIARRMTQSARIPQFALARDIDAAWLLAQKEALARDADVGVTDLLLQALGEMVLRHPDLAVSYVEPDDGDRPRLRHHAGVDVGLAVATPRGLLVPVVRGVHDRTLAGIAEDRRRLVGAARSGRLAGADMAGATLTLSNLGGFGVDRFTAMLNPGESAILAVGRVVEQVVPRGRGIAIVPRLTLTLTVDHRVADGATGAAALVELAELLEGGMTWRT
jgi:pyruvate dehydrogenase E2 component (dihydrolipoyllysine-residue acetyltransferase)